MAAAAAQHLTTHPSDPGSGAQHRASNPDGGELVTLEAEITELQRENARVENQMLRLKSDISAMESHLNHNERVSGIFQFKRF